MRRLLGTALLVGTGVLVALVLGEGVARVAFHRSLDLDMEMWKYATRIKVRSSNPHLGHEHRPSSSAFLMGVEVSTNALGMRDDPVPVLKPEDEYRIIVLGDSFTFGWGVEQDLTFVKRLESRLRSAPPPSLPRGKRYRVLNLGVGNYNTSQELALFRSLGAALDPDLVLIAYFVNDAEPSTAAKQPWLLRHSYLAAWIAPRVRRLPFHPTPLPDYETYYRDLYRPGQPGWVATQSALEEFAEEGRARNVPVKVLLLPDLHDVDEPTPLDDEYDLVVEACLQAGLPVIDLLPWFDQGSDAHQLWVTPEDPHPNAKAHDIIADGIYEILAAEGR